MPWSSFEPDICLLYCTCTFWEGDVHCFAHTFVCVKNFTKGEIFLKYYRIWKYGIAWKADSLARDGNDLAFNLLAVCFCSCECQMVLKRDWIIITSMLVRCRFETLCMKMAFYENGSVWRCPMLNIYKCPKFVIILKK